ncbi:hypothetical protein ACQ4M4_00495 [Leptolyngbya sp. AN02str]
MLFKQKFNFFAGWTGQIWQMAMGQPPIHSAHALLLDGDRPG